MQQSLDESDVAPDALAQWLNSWKVQNKEHQPEGFMDTPSTFSPSGSAPDSLSQWSWEELATLPYVDASMENAKIGPYQLLAQIGQGGMGTVYRAYDTQLGRAVAVKLISTRDQERKGWKISGARSSGCRQY